ncbi:DNA replication ATP-dependent helicase/nuclease DNA2 [Hypomesus transpacificus]|uniref:DNA replication ATP-dependent helicase/nuclease DNA2 n=1 Tax=Hypomesus transpacificus TaxID=137520 RepID=UPI001F075056|nr:DNA replication ATP-dependent helicase/nuclease DNA2 [Hypomesus transpacificus]
MNRSKVQRTSTVIRGQQSNISSFFSSKKLENSSPQKITEAEKSEVAISSERSPLGILENVLSSPDFMTVPETPDSQIRPPQQSSKLPEDQLSQSPVSRMPGSRGIFSLKATCRLSMRNKTSSPATTVALAPVSPDLVPARGQTGRRKADLFKGSGSVKRLFSPEDAQTAKRARTSSKPVTRPSLSTLQHTRVPGDGFLEECLQVIGQSESSGILSKGALKKSKSGQIVLTDKGKIKKEMTSLKPLSVSSSSVSSKSNSGSMRQVAAQKEESVFTVITEPTATVKANSPTHVKDIGSLVISKRTDQLIGKLPLREGLASPCPPEHPSNKQEENKQVDGEEPDGTGVKSSEKGQVRTEGADGKGVTLSEDHLEGLVEGWLDDQMEQSFNNIKDDQDKSRTGKKNIIPDHVILSSGENNRYWVLDVQEVPGSRGALEKHLTITCSNTLQPTHTCILRDGWVSSPVSRRDVVHLEGRCDSGTWLVDRDSGFLVLLPDLLVSGTSISSGIRCMRRAVLGEMFKSFDGGSKQMLNGTMVHEIFQKAAMRGDFSITTLQQLANQALLSPNYLGDMYSLNLRQEDMRQEVWDYLPALADWARDYLHTSPQAGQKQITLKLPSDGPMSRQDSVCSVTVAEVVDIEENVWSPRFGLKGKIDVTARVRIQRRGRAPVERLMPLELKTGRESNSIEHRSQVILYTLMSLERRCDAEAGLLLYLKTGSLLPIVANHMDRRELLKLRNTLAHHLGNTVVKGAGQTRLSALPDIITDRQTCKYCPQSRNCALYDRAVESRLPDYASHDAVQAFLEQESGHAMESHLQYFSHWLLLCSLEAVTMETKNGRKRVWLQTAEEREKRGGCVGNLQLIGEVKTQSDGVFIHRFERRSGAADQTVSGLAVGDRVVVSDEKLQLVAVATGYICDVASRTVSCTLDRDLSRHSGVVFRVDHDEGVIGLSTHLVNLSKLMENCPPSLRLRELIVDFRPPQFISSLSSVLPHEAKDTVAKILKGLNKPQKQAMKKVLLCKDYTLIVGMPGTGKTTTICTLVRILYACGFSVLLTSYTHSAVDNILLKLRRFKVGFLRLGRSQKVHPDILAYTEERGRADGIHTLPELEQFYNKELVVATTCMGVKHPIFTRRRFDFCIVDEASQICQPVCLGPLFYAERFVLVGDHQQLPPIVQNQEARSLGMDESLFKRLEHHKEAVVQLTVQYRMNSKIMSLSNTLMYEGRLECGSERTASGLLALPHLETVQSELELCLTRPEDLAWIQAALLPNNPVCFLDTTLVPAGETVEQGGVINQTEAVLVHRLLSLVLKAGCRASDIGVIAPYRQQLKTISGLLVGSEFKGVEVNTVDKYQGRDKSLIIVSFVRSHPDGNLGELLKDWRRLNVAVTRAKHKLLMLGSIPTLRRYAPLEKLLNHLQQENMIFQLPLAAHEVLPIMHL